MSGIGVLMLGTGGGAGAAVTITVNPASLYAYNPPGFTASSQFQLATDGKAYQITNGGAAVALYNWCVPASETANYEVYATLTAGSLSSGSSVTGSWLALSAARNWRVSTTSGIIDATVNIGIRRIGTTTILGSADIYLNAEVS